MKKSGYITLQELAEYMRDAAYSDNQSHKIAWSLHVVHPKTEDGDVGFNGGLWTDRLKTEKAVSVSFSYSETKGIYKFKVWLEGSEVRYDFGEAPTVEEFKDIIKKIFNIEQLYIHR